MLELTSQLSISEPKLNHGSAYFPKLSSSQDADCIYPHAPGIAGVAPDVRHVLLGSNQSAPFSRQGHPRILGLHEHHLEDNLKTPAFAQTGRASSDAITQITTESPEKTTFSAEIYVNTDDGDTSTLGSCHEKVHGIHNRIAPTQNQPSSSYRPIDQPLLLPYKPSGVSEMYYVPYWKAAPWISPVRSE
uniref:Uncharacterized protein n=1 Tax=Sphenodon punctatus TaxID=8508 RepID=A0A8D0H8S0_SPHPU